MADVLCSAIHGTSLHTQRAQAFHLARVLHRMILHLIFWNSSRCRPVQPAALFKTPITQRTRKELRSSVATLFWVQNSPLSANSLSQYCDFSLTDFACAC